MRALSGRRPRPSRLHLPTLLLAHLICCPPHWLGAAAFTVTVRRDLSSRVFRPFLLDLGACPCPSRRNESRNAATRRPQSTALSSSSSDDGTATKRRQTLNSLVQDYDCEVLSEDPLVYIVPNLLSPEECRAYIERATSGAPPSDGGDDDESRTMTRSNPPEVSLDAKRLWPLPFLCLGAAVPPLIRLFESYPADGATSSPTMNEIVRTAASPVLLAATIATGLAFGITQIISNRSASTSRTSDALALNAESDGAFIHDLVDRASTVTGGHPWYAFEAPVVTRYQKGAVFATHNDASPTLGSEWADVGGQRVVTVITYLNTCPKGGGTRFDRLGLTVQPMEGAALVFYPADEDTLVADDRTRHESLPAMEEKYIVQLFGRVGPRVPPPLGIPDGFSER